MPFNIFFEKILVVCLLAGIIGLEREKSEKPVGWRTSILIALGACLCSLFTYLYPFESFDRIRLLAYYIAAVGFLSPIVRQEGNIYGLTTGALLLPLSLMGFICGVGRYDLALGITATLWLVLKLKVIEKKL